MCPRSVFGDEEACGSGGSYYQVNTLLESLRLLCLQIGHQAHMHAGYNTYTHTHTHTLTETTKIFTHSVSGCA